MTQLSAQWTLSQTAGVQQAIRMSMVKNALTIANEAADNLHPVRHLKRHTLATQVLRDPDYWLMRFVYTVVAQDTLTVSSTDAQINTAIASIFDPMACVDAADLIDLVVI